MWRKYKGWYLQVRGEEFPEEVDTDESEDEYRMKTKEEEPEWVKLYLNPSTFIHPTDDPEDSDDGLDVERKIAIGVINPQEGSLVFASMMKHMIHSRRHGGVGEKITDEFVTSFKSAIKTQAETSNKKKLFILKVQLLNVKEEIFRIVQV